MVLLNALLLSFIVLYLIRLYHDNNHFARFLNSAFATLDQWIHRFFAPSKSRLRLFLIIAVCTSIIMGITALFVGGNFFTAFLISFLFITICLPLLLEFHFQQQITDIQKVVDLIKFRNISAKDLDAVKAAIRQYYAQQYAPHFPRGIQSNLFTHLIGFIVFLIHPEFWPRQFISRLTAIKGFDSFFYNSPYHARFKFYQPVADIINYYGKSQPYRMKIKMIEVADNLVMFHLQSSASHQAIRARTLAKKIEADLNLVPNSVMVQNQAEGLALFIPAASLQSNQQ